MTGKPHSPETLADRWGCSAEKVRRMYHEGLLPGFRLGKLIRIPAAEVDRFECQNTDSLSTAETTASPTLMTNEDVFALRLARQTPEQPKPERAIFGRSAPPLSANG